MVKRIMFVLLCMVFTVVNAQEALVSDESPIVEDSSDQALDESLNMEEKPEMPLGKVIKAAFTLSVVDRMPQDDLDRIDSTVDNILFFTDLRGLQGQVVRHVWFYQGNVMANIEFNVKGPRWRVWSSKSLLPNWLGSWTVKVMDAKDRVIYEQNFEYVSVKP